MSNHRKVTVLGAGLAGMSSAAELARSGVDVTVLERDPVVGGLAKSLHRNGYTVDLGPHRFHGEPGVVQHFHDLMGENLVENKRKSRIWMMNRFFFYPLRVENVLMQLPRTILIKILIDYVTARVKQRLNPKPDLSFEDWVTHRFGKTLYTIFFDVYTEKTWGLPCKQISSDWASQRISLLSLGDVIKKTLQPKQKPQPRTYVSSFSYPKHGGVGAICGRYQAQVQSAGGKVVTSIRLEKVKTDGKRVTSIVYQNGDLREVDTPGHVISSIPPQALLGLLDPAPPAEILEHAAKLQHRSLVFVYVVLKKENLTDDHWVYIPEKSRLLNRISEAKNFSRDNAPEGYTAVCAEITCIQGDEIWTADDRWLGERVITELADMGFMKKKEAVDTFVHREPQGYPVYEIGYREHLKALQEHLGAYENLLVIGRQGLFRYNNMDHSVTMGQRAAHTVLGRIEDFQGVAASGDYFD